MKTEDLEYMQSTIEDEGFDYTFMDYDHNYDYIKDIKFHILRKAYIKSHKELAEYLQMNE